MPSLTTYKNLPTTSKLVGRVRTEPHILSLPTINALHVCPARALTLAPYLLTPFCRGEAGPTEKAWLQEALEARSICPVSHCPMLCSCVPHGMNSVYVSGGVGAGRCCIIQGVLCTHTSCNLHASFQLLPPGGTVQAASQTSGLSPHLLEDGGEGGVCPGTRWCQGNLNKTTGWLPLAWDGALWGQACFLPRLNILPNKNRDISASPVAFVRPFVCQRRRLADHREQASCAWIWVQVWIWLPPPLTHPSV